MLNTTQKLGKVTLERLREHGKMGDSFNRVLNRLLDKIEDLEDQLDDQSPENNLEDDQND